jgi:hypothetical protein
MESRRRRTATYLAVNLFCIGFGPATISDAGRRAGTFPPGDQHRSPLFAHLGLLRRPTWVGYIYQDYPHRPSFCGFCDRRISFHVAASNSLFPLCPPQNFSCGYRTSRPSLPYNYHPPALVLASVYAVWQHPLPPSLSSPRDYSSSSSYCKAAVSSCRTGCFITSYDGLPYS